MTPNLPQLNNAVQAGDAHVQGYAVDEQGQ